MSMPVSAARAAAFQVLLRVETAERHADDLLHGAALQYLTPRDRALATNLVMGTLRWQLALDSSTAPLLRAGTILAPVVAIALRMGLMQLWYMDRIPAHAALSESVELVKQNGFAGMAGLVNAILRKLSRQARPDLQRAAVLAHPAWLVDRWCTNYGTTAAEAICMAGQQIPRNVLRKRPGSAASDALLPAEFLTAAGLENEDAASEEKALAQLRTQDEGSQLVAELAAAAAPDARRVLDSCAAPGGKTAILAERLPGARMVACDSSATRLQTMRRLMPADLAAQIDMVQADAAQPARSPLLAQPFDLVLCDVPCSGTGTLARNPEIRLTLHAPQLARYAQKQLQILKTSWGHVARGGTLVYSTCSIEPEENAAVVEHFLDSTAGAVEVPVEDVLGAMFADAVLTQAGAASLLATARQGNALRTLPGIHPCDGFFAAVLRKT